jgi:hypothetical protein
VALHRDITLRRRKFSQTCCTKDAIANAALFFFYLNGGNCVSKIYAARSYACVERVCSLDARQNDGIHGQRFPQ